MLPIHHLAVLVVDLERAERFYGGLLGLPVLARHADHAGDPRSVWLSLHGGAFLAIEKASGPPRDEELDDEPGWHLVALGIDRGEREVWRMKLTAGGYPIERETEFTLYVRDPDENLVALSHYPER